MKRIADRCHAKYSCNLTDGISDSYAACAHGGLVHRVTPEPRAREIDKRVPIGTGILPQFSDVSIKLLRAPSG